MEPIFRSRACLFIFGICFPHIMWFNVKIQYANFDLKLVAEVRAGPGKDPYHRPTK